MERVFQSAHPQTGSVTRYHIRIPRADVLSLDEQLYWYVQRRFRGRLIEQNRFDSRPSHPHYAGSYWLRDVCLLRRKLCHLPHNVSLADLLQLWAFLGGVFIWMFVRCIFQSFIFFKSLTISDVQVPETKGLTLEEMDEVFGDSAGTALADQQRHADISRRLGLDKVAQDHGDVFNNDDKSSQKEKV